MGGARRGGQTLRKRQAESCMSFAALLPLWLLLHLLLLWLLQAAIAATSAVANECARGAQLLDCIAECAEANGAMPCTCVCVCFRICM